MTTAVCLEVGSRRTFASVLEWPGWCRAGKGEEAALEALARAAPRYAVVAREAGVRFPARVAQSFEVVERLPGTATTDFGAPGQVASAERAPLTAAEARRLAALLTAAWTVFDRVVAGAPAELRKGPRGGGRDRDKIVEHVLGAEAGYARSLGIRLPPPSPDDLAGVSALRRAIVDVLASSADRPPPAGKGWPPRYTARRLTWHVLDHAWEIEDRSRPAPGG